MSGPDQTPKAGAEETQGSEVPQGPRAGSGEQAEPPAADPSPAEADGNLPARLGDERLSAPVSASATVSKYEPYGRGLSIGGGRCTRSSP